MLLTRIITALAALVIIVPALGWGGVPGVSLLVLVFSTISAWELARCFPAIKTWYSRSIVIALGIGCVAGFRFLPYAMIPAVLVWLPLLILLLHLFLYNHIRDTIESAGQMAFIPFYVVIPLCHAISLRKLDFGIAWVFFVLVVNCLGDAGAYFAGKNFGKHRFSKSVSPGKTVEGLVGGLIGNYVGMLIIKLIVMDLAPIALLAKLTLLIAVMGPLGDLCASAIKRRLGIKDFGHIMPGHGGVLDRADSLIMVFPAAFYFLVISGWVVPK
jgi:phosphatidate cytidylyltransferase